MNGQHPNDWARSKHLDFEPKAVLMALVLRDGSRGCFPKTQTLMDDLGCSRTLLFKCLAYLEDIGLITRIQQHRSKGSNEYRIHYEDDTIEPSYAYKRPRGFGSDHKADVRTADYSSASDVPQESVRRTTAVRTTDKPREASEEASGSSEETSSLISDQMEESKGASRGPGSSAGGTAKGNSPGGSPTTAEEEQPVWVQEALARMAAERARWSA